MGVVQSFLKGRTPREKNWCSVASSSSIRRILKSQNGSCAKLSERVDTSKKFGVLLKNTQESKRELCKVVWKGGYPKKMWCSVGSPSSIRRRTLRSSKWELCGVTWKGGYHKKIWYSVGSSSSIRRRTLKSLKWELCRVIWKGGYFKKTWCSVGSPSSIRRGILKG
jgi:hypothetical protein